MARRARRAVVSETAMGRDGGLSDVTARRGIVNQGGLFSPYYLFDVMAKLHRDELDRQGIAELAFEVRSLFRRAARRLEAGSTRAETWAVWHDPLLGVLGLHPADLAEPVETPSGMVPVGTALPGPDGEPLVLVDLHGVDTDLDRGKYVADHDVSTQPISLAFEAAVDAHPTARWGLLGNGSELRLYREGGQVSRQYLAAVFAALVDGDLPDEWTALYACFRGASFVDGADKRCFLDRILLESGQHTRRIADDLRENVRDAVEALARGVLAQPENRPLWGDEPPDRGVAQHLFEETLYFLYRILFVAFAEAHDLLPAASSQAYRNAYSFEHLRDVCDAPLPAGAGDRTYLWDTLRALTRLVRDGYGTDDELAPFIIPPLGGELFSTARTIWLDQAVVTDHYMHAVIRALSLDRSGRRGAPSRFSYLDLGVDQLGSVYEGLLAYEADIATETMTEARLLRNGKPTGDVLLVPLAAVEAAGG